jgi:hypothetical protein
MGISIILLGISSGSKAADPANPKIFKHYRSKNAYMSSDFSWVEIAGFFGLLVNQTGDLHNVFLCC